MAPPSKKSKLYRMLLPAVALAVAFGLLYAYYIDSVYRSGDEVEEFARYLSASAASSVGARLRSIEEISFQFIANRDLNEALSDYSDQQDKYQVAQYNMSFANFLEGQAFIRPEIIDAVFWDYDDAAKKALTMSEVMFNDSVSSLKMSEFAAEIRAAGGAPVWTDSVRVEPAMKDSLLIGRIVKHTFKDSPIGYLIMMIDRKFLLDAVKQAADAELYYSIGSLREDFIGLFSGSGADAMIMAGTGDEELIAEAYRNLGVGSLIPGSQSGPQLYASDIDGDRHLFMVSTVPETGWKLVVPMMLRASTGYLFRTNRVFARNIAIGAVAILVFIGLFYAWIRRSGKERLIAEGKPAGVGPSLEGIEGAGLPKPQDGPPDAPTDGQASSMSDGCPDMATAVARDKSGVLAGLTEKELRLLCLIARGYSNKKIADTIFVAEQTVKNSCSALYQKLGVEDRVGASVLATKLGLPLEGDEGRGQ